MALEILKLIPCSRVISNYYLMSTQTNVLYKLNVKCSRIYVFSLASGFQPLSFGKILGFLKWHYLCVAETPKEEDKG